MGQEKGAQQSINQPTGTGLRDAVIHRDNALSRSREDHKSRGIWRAQGMSRGSRAYLRQSAPLLAVREAQRQGKEGGSGGELFLRRQRFRARLPGGKAHIPAKVPTIAVPRVAGGLCARYRRHNSIDKVKQGASASAREVAKRRKHVKGAKQRLLGAVGAAAGCAGSPEAAGASGAAAGERG